MARQGLAELETGEGKTLTATLAGRGGARWREFPCT